MRATVLYGPKDVRLEQVPDPKILEPTDAIIRVLVACICGVLATAYYGTMDFGSGLMFGLKVVLLAAVGGQSEPLRSALGAALYGLAEALWGAYLPLAWREMALFAGLVLLAVVFRREARI